jgi:hypothetical protein
MLTDAAGRGHRHFENNSFAACGARSGRSILPSLFAGSRRAQLVSRLEVTSAVPRHRGLDIDRSGAAGVRRCKPPAFRRSPQVDPQARTDDPDTRDRHTVLRRPTPRRERPSTSSMGSTITSPRKTSEIAGIVSHNFRCAEPAIALRQTLPADVLQHRHRWRGGPSRQLHRVSHRVTAWIARHRATLRYSRRSQLGRHFSRPRYPPPNHVSVGRMVPGTDYAFPAAELDPLASVHRAGLASAGTLAIVLPVILFPWCQPKAN